jgi:glucokinase
MKQQGTRHKAQGNKKQEPKYKHQDTRERTMNDNIILGVDIGGSHITAALVDMTKHAVIESTCVRRPVNSLGYTEDIIDSWAIAIEESWKSYNVKNSKIGIAMPGPFDYENGISFIKGLNKYETLYQQPVKQLLAKRLKILASDIKMINDASAFLLGEVKSGAAKGCSRVVGITLGTGVGSALYLNNTLHEGDLWCTVFKQGKAEDYLSTRWFIQQYGMISGKVVRGVKELQQLAMNDVRVKNIFCEFGRHLANVLIQKYAQHKPDIIVTGGNIARSWDLFMPAAQEYFSEHNIVMNVQPALLQELAAVIGSASCSLNWV